MSLSTPRRALASLPVLRALALALSLASSLLTSCTSYYHVSCDYWPPPALTPSPKPTPLTLDPVLDSRPEITSSSLPPHHLGFLSESKPILTEHNEPLAAALQRALAAELNSLGYVSTTTPNSLRLAVSILDYTLDPNSSPTLRSRIHLALLTPSGTTLHEHTVTYTANIYAHRYYGAWPALDYIHGDMFSDLIQVLVRRNQQLRAAIAAFGPS